MHARLSRRIGRTGVGVSGEMLIVHENVLVIFPLALAFLFLLFGLVIAFSK
jgi:hypothetical protein